MGKSKGAKKESEHQTDELHAGDLVREQTRAKGLEQIMGGRVSPPPKGCRHVSQG